MYADKFGFFSFICLYRARQTGRARTTQSIPFISSDDVFKG